MKRMLAIVLILVSASACTVPAKKAERILDSAGYTEVDLGGRAWLACSEDDSLATAFVAVGPTGKSVRGAVCCGWFAKNCTIRLD